MKNIKKKKLRKRKNKFSKIVKLLSLTICVLSLITIVEIDKRTKEFESNRYVTYFQDLEISAGASDAILNTNVDDATIENSDGNITMNPNDDLDNGEIETEEVVVPEVETITEEIYGETNYRLNYRVEPNTNSDIIMTLPKGAKLRLLEKHGDWYLATRGDYTGYIHGDYITLTDDPVEIRTVKIYPNEKCSAEIQHTTKDLAEKYKIPVEILMGIEYWETRYNPSAVSKKDGRDYGICQIRDVNHAWLRKSLGRYLDFFNYYDNIEAACYMINEIRGENPGASWEYVLLVYNRGPKSANQWVSDHGTSSSPYTVGVLAKAKELGFTGR